MLIGRAAERAVSAFSWLFEKFCSKFSNTRSLQILTFKPTYSVEEQAIAWRQFKKGEPKASHRNSKRLFVLKAKTLERLDTFVCLKKFAYCGQVPRLWPLSLRLRTS